jgi:hypothetical protein
MTDSQSYNSGNWPFLIGLELNIADSVEKGYRTIGWLCGTNHPVFQCLSGMADSAPLQEVSPQNCGLPFPNSGQKTDFETLKQANPLRDFAPVTLDEPRGFLEHGREPWKKHMSD